MFANEQATRDENEADLFDATGATFEIHCECGADDCTGMIEIPASEYRAVRLASRRYIIKVGHEIPDIETTLTTTPNYLIVEKG
jgi:hypothetical protein